MSCDPRALLGASQVELWNLTRFTANAVTVKSHISEFAFLPQSAYEYRWTVSRLKQTNKPLIIHILGSPVITPIYLASTWSA